MPPSMLSYFPSPTFFSCRHSDSERFNHFGGFGEESRVLGGCLEFGGYIILSDRSRVLRSEGLDQLAAARGRVSKLEQQIDLLSMQRALLAASRTSLFAPFGGRYSGGAAAVRLHNTRSRVAFGGLSTQASEDSKAEVEDDSHLVAAGGHPNSRKSYREDMSESYGSAYSTRSSEEGYGERYGEAVKAVLDKRDDKMEMQRGETSERDQNADAFADVDYDTSQGERVGQREDARHAKGGAAYEDEGTAKERAKDMGSRGGGAT